MKKRLLLFLGVLGSFGYYSWTTKVINDADTVQPNKAAPYAPKRRITESPIFDPTHLVSASQHGKLDTLQK